MTTMNLAAPVGARFSLKQLLVVDALTCMVTGILLTMASPALASLLGLPGNLLFYAGVVLFPCAALMAVAARTLAKPLVWIVILGNMGWAAASVIVVFAFETTLVGLVFVLAQAAVVAALGAMEWRARN